MYHWDGRHQEKYFTSETEASKYFDGVHRGASRGLFRLDGKVLKEWFANADWKRSIIGHYNKIKPKYCATSSRINDVKKTHHDEYGKC